MILMWVEVLYDIPAAYLKMIAWSSLGIKVHMYCITCMLVNMYNWAQTPVIFICIIQKCDLC